jgi:uncharacterized repeat protein (TIGR03803 family)
MSQHKHIARTFALATLLLPVATSAATFLTIHPFAGGPSDGSQSMAGLTHNGAYLYGTTCLGGAAGTGSVFRIKYASPYAYTFMNSFAVAPDGACPRAELKFHAGLAYGTTYGGGAPGEGTTFFVTPTIPFPITHLTSFSGNPDGRNTFSSLLWHNGAFWGTSQFGGAADIGTVFSLSGTTETPVYAFPTTTDGYAPSAGLIYHGGYFYGTTNKGGHNDHGIIFRIKATAPYTKTTIHDFTGFSDGAAPGSPLLYNAGLIYGVAGIGGINNGGTLFAIQPASPFTFTTVYQFGTVSTDSTHPTGDLAIVGGKIYGTTGGAGGGDFGSAYQFDPGPMAITDSYPFTGGTDGGAPKSGLLYQSGAFYGTTSYYGDPANDGTIFRVTFP